MSKFDEWDVAAGVIGVLLVPLLLVALTMYAAWPIWALWGWFVAPIFGLPVLSFWGAVGLTLFLSSLKGYRKNSDKYEAKDWIMAFSTPPLLVGCGWFIQTLT